MQIRKVGRPCPTESHGTCAQTSSPTSRSASRSPAAAVTRSRPTARAATHVCADRGGAHLLHLQARCHRGQQALSWVQTDVPVSQAALWAHIDSGGRLVAGGGLVVRHLSAGTYGIAVTGPCSRVFNGPAVSVVDGNPPFPTNGSVALPPGAFPVAWLAYTGGTRTFDVFTGVVVNGSFTPADRDFNLQDFC